MIDYVTILTHSFPDTQWSLIGNDYNDLIWLSNTPKPTKATLDALLDKVQAEIKFKAEAKAQAKAALLERLGITEDEARLLLA